MVSQHCRRGSNPTSPPIGRHGRRRALHVPNSVGGCANSGRWIGDSSLPDDEDHVGVGPRVSRREGVVVP